MRHEPTHLLFFVIVAAIGAAADGCSSSPAAADAGSQDAVTEEGGTLDAATDDAGTTDGETTDGATTDGAAADRETPDGPSDDMICAQGCQLGTDAGCGVAHAVCVDICRADLGKPGCYAEKRAMQLCVIAAGLDAIACMNGQTFIKQGYCEIPKGALTACLLGARADAGAD